MPRITQSEYRQAIIKRAKDLEDSIRNDYYAEIMVDTTSDRRIKELKALFGISRLFGVDLKAEISKKD